MSNLMAQLPRAENKSTSQLLNEIGLVYRENLEMIQTIDKSGSVKRPLPNLLKKNSFFHDLFKEDLPSRQVYEIGLSDRGLFLTENNPLEKQRAADRAKWAVQSRLIAIPDRFKEKIDYNCSSFSDLKRLNEQMNNLAQHYGAFGDNPTCHAELEQIQQNLNTLKTDLKKIYKFYQKSDEQIQQEVQTKLDHINQELFQLLADYPCLTFRQCY